MFFRDTKSVQSSKFTRAPHIPDCFSDYSPGLRAPLHVPSNCFRVISSVLLSGTVSPTSDGSHEQTVRAFSSLFSGVLFYVISEKWARNT